MSKALNALVAGEIRPEAPAWQVATLSRIDADGICYVAWPGTESVSAARVLTGVAAELAPGREVLVAVPADGPPVIVGAVADAVEPAVAAEPAAGTGAERAPGTGAEPAAEPARAADGHLRLSAEKTVSIECGASAITLRRDGTVVIRGRNVISRASGENKLRGCTVKIN